MFFFSPNLHFVFLQLFHFFQDHFTLNVPGSAQGTVYTGRELEYAFFVHSLCVLGKVLIYTHGRRLFPVQAVKHKGKKEQPL